MRIVVFMGFFWLGMVNVMFKEVVLVENDEELIILCIVKDEIIVDRK